MFCYRKILDYKLYLLTFLTNVIDEVFFKSWQTVETMIMITYCYYYYCYYLYSH